MTARTILVTGGSCTGKSTVRREVARRGIPTVDGDRDLAFQGDPTTGEPLPPRPGGRPVHEHHLWDVGRARACTARSTTGPTIVCGDARNLDQVLHLFDRVIVLRIDETTLRRRLDSRPPDEFGATPDERDLVLRLHRQPGRWPTDAVVLDATRPVTELVDEILSLP